MRAATIVKPEHLEAPMLRRAYLYLSVQLMHGVAVGDEPSVLVEMEQAMARGENAADHLEDAARETLAIMRETASKPGLGDARMYAKHILQDDQARAATHELLKFAGTIESQTGAYYDRAMERPEPNRILDRVREGVLKIHRIVAVRPGESRAMLGREEVLTKLTDDMNREGARGIRWPYPKMEQYLGTDIQPGGVYGFTARSGGGKTLLGANLFRKLIRYAHVVPALTEHPEQWMARAVAAEAGVEQAIAEQGRWNADDENTIRFLRRLWQRRFPDGAGGFHHGRELDSRVRWLLKERRAAYEKALASFRVDRSWEYLGMGRMTLDELLLGWRMARSLWPDKHVIGILDHAHNLKEEPIHERIAEIVARIKEFCENDPAGFSAIVFFQPRKLDRMADKMLAKVEPVPAGEISGSVEQYLDTHAGLCRQWVEVDRDQVPLEWGQSPCKRTLRGFPVRVPKKEKDMWRAPYARLDNEHLYMFADKTRIARHEDEHEQPDGLIVLNCRGPYGTVEELTMLDPPP